MAVTTDAFTGADLAAFIPEVWSSMVLEELFAKTCLANFCTDLSGYATNGGDIFHVADVYTNSFTPQTQSTQGAEVTTAGPAQVDVTLTIDTHKYIAYIIGDKDLVQLRSRPEYSETYAAKAGRTLADALEDSLAALWSGLSTNSIGDTATVLTDLEIRQSISALDAANFPLSECAFFVHPTCFWTQIAAIAKFYDVSQRGNYSGPGFTVEGNFGNMDASRGLKGMLYGVPVYSTSNIVSALATFRNLLLHKDALGFALQTPGGSKVRVQTENAIRNLGLLTVTDILYGVIELRDAAGVVVNASNSATTS